VDGGHHTLRHSFVSYSWPRAATRSTSPGRPGTGRASPSTSTGTSTPSRTAASGPTPRGSSEPLVKAPVPVWYPRRPSRPAPSEAGDAGKPHACSDISVKPSDGLEPSTPSLPSSTRRQSGEATDARTSRTCRIRIEGTSPGRDRRCGEDVPASYPRPPGVLAGCDRSDQETTPSRLLRPDAGGAHVLCARADRTDCLRTTRRCPPGAASGARSRPAQRTGTPPTRPRSAPRRCASTPSTDRPRPLAGPACARAPSASGVPGGRHVAAGGLRVGARGPGVGGDPRGEGARRAAPVRAGARSPRGRALGVRCVGRLAAQPTCDSRPMMAGSR